MDEARVERGARLSAARVVVGALAVAALAVVAVPVVARAGGWEQGPLAFAVALTPWVAVAFLVPAILGAAARAWLVVGLALLLGMIAAWWQVPLYIADGSRNTDAEPLLTVATLNVAQGAADAEAVVDLVRDHGVEVLAVQELTPDAEAALETAGLTRLLPHVAGRSGRVAEGTALYSAHPLTGATLLEGMPWTAVRAVVSSPEEEVTVLVAHPASPGLREHEQWRADLDTLTGWLEEAEGPTLVAGALNTTREHLAFRGIEELGYVDAADQAGAGLVATFPAVGPPWPLAAIDHVLTRDVDLRARNVVSVEVPGGDHRALVAAFGS